MKRTKVVWFLTVLILMGVFWLGGCSNENQQAEKRSIRIGVSLYRGDDTFINNVRAELEQKAKSYELETGIKVTLDIQDAKGNQNTQNNQVERFLSLGCDVLCINLVDRTNAAVIIDKAIDADVAVVFFNRQPVDEDLNRWEGLYYVGVDAKENAVLQGQIVIDVYREDPAALDLNGDGVISYVLLEGESSHQDSLIRTEWAIQTLKDAAVPIERITGGIGNWERSQGSALMEQWLQTYPDEIELVISNNDDMALGAIDALDRLNIKGINLVGIDATVPGLEAVQNGRMLGTVSSDKAIYADAIFTIAAARALDQDVAAQISLEDGRFYWTPQKVVQKSDYK